MKWYKKLFGFARKAATKEVVRFIGNIDFEQIAVLIIKAEENKGLPGPTKKHMVVRMLNVLIDIPVLGEEQEQAVLGMLVEGVYQILKHYVWKKENGE